jgi:hypothetical protein
LKETPFTGRDKKATPIPFIYAKMSSVGGLPHLLFNNREIHRL